MHNLTIVMLLPAEIETKTSIPALRALIAKKLIGVHKMNQKQAANSLGVTQAAISNYMRGTRGTGGHRREPTRPGRC